MKVARRGDEQSVSGSLEEERTLKQWEESKGKSERTKDSEAVARVGKTAAEARNSTHPGNLMSEDEEGYEEEGEDSSSKSHDNQAERMREYLKLKEELEKLQQ